MNEEELKGECDLKVVGMEQNFNEPLEDFQQGLGRVCLTLMCVYISLFLQSKINTDNIYQNWFVSVADQGSFLFILKLNSGISVLK